MASSCEAARLGVLTRVSDQSLHEALGLTNFEYARICELLERDPNHFELAVFSLLWSEHCGYKHSARLLKRLPSAGERVLQGPGENAGVIDLGEGEAVAFKVESHNHPSAVEPFQGAATGVGGILRDIVAMGARPVALLDGLRFGAPDWSFRRAVAGIGHYGNCVGVPTVGGEAVFDAAYAGNCLVNAMCVGLLPAERVTRAGARGVGNVLVLYGATTGRDGIGGASVLASQELGEDDADKRPTVQVGDPFTGKKLIEASLELVEAGLVESLQDCGAAGLASSLAEMAREVGVDVHLDRVPLREEGMEPWEIMISESQERMVAVVRPERLAEVEAVLSRWELHHAAIGEVTETGELRAFWDDERRSARSRPRSSPTSARATRSTGSRPRGRAAEVDPVNLEPKEWIYEQYDQLVLSRTVRRPGLDAAVLQLRPSWRGLAVSLDGPPPGCRDPREAGRAAVLGAARNVACAGGEPLALTDCLNFGNPEKPEIGWELAEAIEAIAETAEALGDSGRLGQRLALQRDRRAGDSADAGRRVRRPRARRARGAARLAAGRPRLAGRGRRGRADRLALAQRVDALARPRRRRRRPRARAGGGLGLQRPRVRGGCRGAARLGDPGRRASRTGRTCASSGRCA